MAPGCALRHNESVNPAGMSDSARIGEVTGPARPVPGSEGSLIPFSVQLNLIFDGAGELPTCLVELSGLG